MMQLFVIPTIPVRTLLLVCYLFAAVFGIGVHAHEQLSHHHEGIDEHAHDFVVHAHNDLNGLNETPAIVAKDVDHEHNVATVQLSGVQNSSSTQKLLSQPISIISLATDTFSLSCNDLIIVAIQPDDSPPLQTFLTSNLLGRSPPVA